MARELADKVVYCAQGLGLWAILCSRALQEEPMTLDMPDEMHASDFVSMQVKKNRS